MKTKIVPYLVFGLVFLSIVGLGIYTYIHSLKAEVVVEWSTASELNTVGFNLFRSDTPIGPGKLLNENLIPASTDAQTGGNYRYVDKKLKAGKVYYYFLEDVSITGKTNVNGPVMVKVNSDERMVGYLSLGVAGLMLCGILIFILVYKKNRIKGDE